MAAITITSMGEMNMTTQNVGLAEDQSEPVKVIEGEHSKDTKQVSSTTPTLNILLVWCYETALVALIPICVIFTVSFTIEGIRPLRIAEWAMTSTIVLGDTLRKIIRFILSRRSESIGTDERAWLVVLTSVSLIGVIVSSVSLAFVVPEHLGYTTFRPGTQVYFAHKIMLAIALLLSACITLYVEHKEDFH